MIEMLMEKATDVRKEWSAVCDSVIHDKPKFIKRTRDKMWFSNIELMLELLAVYRFTAQKIMEEDGSVTLSLNEIDLVENGSDEADVRLKMGNAIIEYSVTYYNEYTKYSHSPNRRHHIPYIFKALMMDNPKEIGDGIVCQDGEN